MCAAQPPKRAVVPLSAMSYRLLGFRGELRGVREQPSPSVQVGRVPDAEPREQKVRLPRLSVPVQDVFRQHRHAEGVVHGVWQQLPVPGLAVRRNLRRRPVLRGGQQFLRDLFCRLSGLQQRHTVYNVPEELHAGDVGDGRGRLENSAMPEDTVLAVIGLLALINIIRQRSAVIFF